MKKYSKILINEILYKFNKDALMHYNHNHDKLGRFARSIGGNNSQASKSKDNKKLLKKLKTDRIGDHADITDLANSIKDNYEEVQKKRDALEKALKPVDKYWSDEKTQNKYIQIAADYSTEKYASNKTKPVNEEIDDGRWFYKYEDGDQGSTSSINFYLLDNGYDPTKVNSDYRKAKEQYDNAINKALTDYLGEYKDTQISTRYGGKDTAQNVARDLIEEHYEKTGYSPQTWKIYEVYDYDPNKQNLKEYLNTYDRKIENDEYWKKLYNSL